MVEKHCATSTVHEERAVERVEVVFFLPSVVFRISVTPEVTIMPGVLAGARAVKVSAMLISAEVMDLRSDGRSVTGKR